MNINSKVILEVNNHIHIPNRNFVKNILNTISKLPEKWDYLGVEIKNIDGSIFQYDPVLLPSMYKYLIITQC
jgi:hypothetical protein